MAVGLAALLLCPPPARAQSDVAIPAKPVAEGRQVFEAKGCAHCHNVLGGPAGPARVGPDLGRSRSFRNVMQLAGTLWNHAPRMLDAMQAQGIQRPTLSPDEMGKLAAYLFYVNFLGSPGDPQKGREVFVGLGCARCHQFAGQGGREGPRLDDLQAYQSPVFLAQSLWNHGPAMAAKMDALHVARPTLRGDDVANLVAYLRGSTSAEQAVEVTLRQVGNPRAGQAVFRDKGCVACHAINGAGGQVGPDLGTRQPPQDVTDVAAAFWNHGPAMAAKMTELGMPRPSLGEREIADVLAYVYFTQFLGAGGDVARGGDLFREKSCASCHAIGADGPQVGPNLATSTAATSPFTWTSALWNHAPAMVARTRETQTPWPQFDDDQMRDLAAFVRSRHASK